VLVKYERVKKVPAYKCVVEYVCDHCGCGMSCTEPGEELPPGLPPMPPPPAPPQDSASDELPVQPVSLTESTNRGFSWKSIFGR
jgi:hypothetical protein